MIFALTVGMLAAGYLISFDAKTEIKVIKKKLTYYLI